jgi:lipoprotein LprG
MSKQPRRNPRITRSKSNLIAAAVALSLSGVLLTACGGGGSNDSDTSVSQSVPPVLETSRSTQPSVVATDPAAVIEQSAQTTRMMNSVHIALVVDDSIESLPIQTINGDVTNQPAVGAQGDGEFRINNNLTQSDFIVTEGNLYTRGDGADSYTNLGPANRIYDPAIILDKDKGLANVISKVQNPTVVGTETVNGVEAIKIEGTIASTELKPILPEVDKTGAELPITLWVTAEAPYNLVQITVEVSGGEVNIVTSKWQEPVTINSPE